MSGDSPRELGGKCGESLAAQPQSWGHKTPSAFLACGEALLTLFSKLAFRMPAYACKLEEVPSLQRSAGAREFPVWRRVSGRRASVLGWRGGGTQSMTLHLRSLPDRGAGRTIGSNPPCRLNCLGLIRRLVIQQCVPRMKMSYSPVNNVTSLVIRLYKIRHFSTSQRSLGGHVR